MTTYRVGPSHGVTIVSSRLNTVRGLLVSELEDHLYEKVGAVVVGDNGTAYDIEVKVILRKK